MSCASKAAHRPALVAEALCKLSCASLNLSKLVDGGATPLLVRLSSRLTGKSSSAAMMRADCLVALCNISYVWAMRDKMVREGAAGALAKHASALANEAGSGGTDARRGAAGMSVAELREICCLALCNLLTNRGTVGVCSAQGATQALVAMVTCAQPVHPVHYANELSPRIANALAMASARHCGIRRQLVDEGAVEACVRLASVQPSVPLQRRDSTAAAHMRLFF